MTFRALLAATMLVAIPSAVFADHATSAQEGYKEAHD